MEIKLQNLTKVFESNKNFVRAVDNLDIIIPSGKLVGLLGPSGCGKSTTLYMIAGLYQPSGGRIFFGEDDVTDLAPEKRQIGLVFQNYALYPHMTVKQNILFPLENLKYPKDLALKEVIEIAKLVGIDDLLERKPAELSGGQQQRVAIARALVKKPKVLLLDEPLSNLDARLRLQTREEIKRIQKETKITTIFVTHDQEEAMSISDEIIVLDKGIMQQRGHPQDVYNNPDNLFVAKFLGTPPINLFKGNIKNKNLYIEDVKILDKIQAEDQEVVIGIRPEGYTISDEGVFKVSINYIEHIGRDVEIVASHKASLLSSFRIIVSETVTEDVKFKIQRDKCFIFNLKDEMRLL